MSTSQSELEKLSSQETWRMFRIMSEIGEGFETLVNLPRAVSIFGSARTKPDHPHYKKTYAIAAALAENGYSVITGAGYGLMEAANKGAKEAGGISVGLHIDLPHEQAVNDYIDIELSFHYFFARKLMFIKYSQAYIVMPGGMGTVDELSEAYVLIQTQKIKPFPLIFVDKEYWKGFFEWVENSMVSEGYLSSDELELVRFAETPEEVLQIIKEYENR